MLEKSEAEEFHWLVRAYISAVDALRVLAKDDVSQAFSERAALLSGIAKAYGSTASDNPRANTVALKLSREIQKQHPEVDPEIIASILAQAFTEASRLCTSSTPSLGAEGRATLYGTLEEDYARALQILCSERTLG